jgi:glycosyltransferase involved in cell wall biosynthesis
MRYTFLSPVSIRPWAWPDLEAGVGGNEQGVGEMAWRLAARGHECNIYCDVPWEEGAREWRGTTWRHFKTCNFQQPGIWLLCRCPQAAAQFAVRPDQKVWLIVQDFEYDWSADYFDRIDRILFTCQTHYDIIARRHPQLLPKMGLTANGVKVDLIEDLERNEALVRNPHKIIYASSPDRGLRNLLRIFGRAREVLPDLELHAFYGFDGIDAIAKRPGGWPPMEREKALITELAARTAGVQLRGRVTQTQLYREWLTSGMMVYCTTFFEMSAVALREAQCGGAVPIVSPVWGLGDNLRHGVAIQGDPADEMTIARFTGEVIRMANPDYQERIRAEMMPDARKAFDWQVYLPQWEEMANG